MRSVACALCGSGDAAPILQLGDLSYEVPGSFRLVRCEHCQLIYVDPRPSPEELARYYPPEYSAFRKAIEDERWFLMRWMRRRNIRRRRRAVEAYTRHRPGQLLDVGCSTGIFLAEMRDAGWHVTGIETSSPAAEYARERFGLDVMQGTLEGSRLPANSFDAITLWDVLEHTDSPLEALHAANQLLRPDGIVVATVPNYDSLDRRLFGPAWIGFDVPRHLTVFTPDTLSRSLLRAGFDVLHLRCDFGGYFTFAASVHRWANTQITSTALRRIVRTFIDLPGLRLPFEPLFGILDRMDLGSELAVVARKVPA